MVGSCCKDNPQTGPPIYGKPNHGLKHTVGPQLQDDAEFKPQEVGALRATMMKFEGDFRCCYIMELQGTPFYTTTTGLI